MNIELLIATSALVVSLSAGLVAPIIEICRDRKARKFERLHNDSKEFFKIISSLNPNHETMKMIDRTTELRGIGYALISNFENEEDRKLIGSCVIYACYEVTACKMPESKWQGKTSAEWALLKDNALDEVIRIVNKQLK